MYRDFYLNKDFFDSFVHCSYPLGGDFYIHIGKVKIIPNGYKKIYQYPVTFECKFEGEFVPVFEGIVNLTSRKIHLNSVKYILDTELKQALFSSFPLAPAWFIPCTRYTLFLRYCYISMNVYRNGDWI